MANINPGGVYAKEDNGISAIATSNSPLLNWGNLKFKDSPYNDKIQGINISCQAGDVVQMEVSFYCEKNGKFEIMNDTFYLKSLSFESSSRITAINYEESRSKALKLLHEPTELIKLLKT